MADGGDSGAGGGEGPLHFSKKDTSTAIYVVQVYFARFDCQLSGKVREDSDRTVVIAVLYWHLPSWRNCDSCYVFHLASPLLASTACGGPGVSCLGLLPVRTMIHLFIRTPLISRNIS